MTAPLSAEKIDFPKLYAGLGTRGIALSDDEKKRFEQITLDEIKNASGISGFMPDSILHLVFKFFALLFNPSQTVDSSNLSNHLSATLSSTTESGKLRIVEGAMQRIYERLRREGDTLASIAEISTQTVVGHVPEATPWSLYTQARADIDLPPEASSNVRIAQNNPSAARG